MERPNDEMFGQILRAMVREEVARALGTEQGAVDDAVGNRQPSPPSGARKPPPGLDRYDRVGFAQHVLRAAGGGPLHVREIAERMYELGYRHRRPPKYPDQLERSLNSLASPSQHPDIFERVGPRTLKLR
jgi:HB1, ASXL, restriction endonuclease HTH domain